MGIEKKAPMNNARRSVGKSSVVRPADKKDSVNRAMIYAHWDEQGLVDDHVLYSLEKYRPWVSNLVFVSTNYKRKCRQLEQLCDKILARENTGFDFASWKAGLGVIDVSKYQEVVFSNSSIYGPFQPMESVFARTKETSADLWGMTISEEHKERHLQTYFFAMKKRVLLSEAAKRFWDDVGPFQEQRDVIELFEMRLLKELELERFRVSAFFDGAKSLKIPWREKLVNLLRHPKKIRQSRAYLKACRYMPYNPTHLQWRQCVDAGVPFLKVDLLRDNPNHLRLGPIFRWIQKNTKYPLDLMKRNLSRIKRTN